MNRPPFTSSPPSQPSPYRYLGRGGVFDKALASFAETYADQNELDFAALQQAAAEARIPVSSGL